MYKISAGSKCAYIAANTDRVRNVLTNNGLEHLHLESEEQITITRVGNVAIDSLTFERLYEEHKKKA